MEPHDRTPVLRSLTREPVPLHIQLTEVRADGRASRSWSPAVRSTEAAARGIVRSPFE